MPISRCYRGEDCDLFLVNPGNKGGHPFFPDIERIGSGGAPGVLSARYAGPACDDAANNRKLIAALAGAASERRSARFRCAMAWVHDGAVALETEDTIEGVIVDDPRGANGFGYDPHFFVPGLGRTLAEAAPQEKNARSHRGKALRTMLALLAERINTG